MASASPPPPEETPSAGSLSEPIPSGAPQVPLTSGMPPGSASSGALLATRSRASSSSRRWSETPATHLRLIRLRIAGRLQRAWAPLERRLIGPGLSPKRFDRFLMRLGLRPGATVMVHSAMEPLAEALPGKSPAWIIERMRALLGAEGTLLMPSFPFRGREVDHLAQGKPFKALRTPSRVGLLTEVFRRTPGVMRSLHPTHPVCGVGPLAEWLLMDHHRGETYAENSPFFRLGEMNGRLGEMNGRLGEMNRRLGEMNGRLGEMNRRLGEMNGRLGEMNGRLGEVNGIVCGLGVGLESFTILMTPEWLDPAWRARVFAAEPVTVSVESGPGQTVECLFHPSQAAHVRFYPLQRRLQAHGVFHQWTRGGVSGCMARAADIIEGYGALMGQGLTLFDPEAAPGGEGR